MDLPDRYVCCDLHNPCISICNFSQNKHVRAFFAYIPYTVLGAMTFPAVFYATGSVISAAAGVAAALALAYRGKGLFTVAICASLVAFLVSIVM